MSAATADLLDRWTGAGTWRWLASLAIVLALHLAVALLILFRHVPMAPVNLPQAPILLDLAPLPAEPMNVHPVPATPPQIQSNPSPQQNQPQAQPPSPPAPPAPQQTAPAAQPQPTSPLLPPSTVATEPHIIVPPPPELAEAPAPSQPVAQIPQAQASSTPALPILPQPNAQVDPETAWQRAVIARINETKPTRVGNILLVGSVDVEIKVDDNGHIVWFGIVRRSGYPEIDHAVRSMMRHADPLPRPPPRQLDVLGEPRDFILTISFDRVPVGQ